jgi:hypothetical protein
VRVRLFEMDGLTQLAAVEVPGLDDVPKLVLWDDRAFVLLAVHRTADEAAYAETVALRLDMSAGACQ